jgi:hypothetical protein
MRNGIKNNPLLVVDGYHNHPCRENPRDRPPKVPTNVAYVSEEEGGISVIDLSTLKVIRRVQPSDLAPMVPGGGVEPPRAEARRILSSQVF